MRGCTGDNAGRHRMPLGQIWLFAVCHAAAGTFFRHMMRCQSGSRSCRDRMLVENAGLCRDGQKCGGQERRANRQQSRDRQFRQCHGTCILSVSLSGYAFQESDRGCRKVPSADKKSHTPLQNPTRHGIISASPQVVDSWLSGRALPSHGRGQGFESLTVQFFRVLRRFCSENLSRLVCITVLLTWVKRTKCKKQPFFRQIRLPGRVPCPYPSSVSQDLASYADGWLLDEEIRQHSTQTRAFRHMMLNKLLWFLREKSLASCSRAELRAFLACMSTGHTAKGGRWGNSHLTRAVRPSTSKTYYFHLRTFFRWLVAEGVLSASPSTPWPCRLPGRTSFSRSPRSRWRRCSRPPDVPTIRGEMRQS